MPILLAAIVSIAVGVVLVVLYFVCFRWRARARLSPEGFQEIEITVKGGYWPDVVEVRRGIPLRMYFRREEDTPCSEQVIFSEFHVGARLPSYQATPVSFIPTRCGEFLFTCAFGMYQGRLIVVEPSKRDLAGIGANGSQRFENRRMAVQGMTCGSCVDHVERALLSVDGVASARVDLGAGAVDINYDPTLVALPTLHEAVEAAGYVLAELPAATATTTAAPAAGRRIPWWPILGGVVGAVLLTGLYVAIVGIAQGLDHAMELLTGDWYFVIPIVVGFGVQVGLFVYVRRGMHLREGTGSTTVLAGAGTGTSTVSMVACCAHHLTDVLPIIGLSGAALFLNDFRGPLMVVGIVTNLIGIAVMVRLIRRVRHHSCAVG